MNKILLCDICGEQLYSCGLEFSTLVGYCSSSGHNHDDNCKTRKYLCVNGHKRIVSKRNRCNHKDCDWQGKIECSCHEGHKLDDWPLE